MSNNVARLTILSILLLALGLPESAGGKAEPRRLVVRGGNVDFTGDLKGDEQYESAIQVKAGEWLMIEIESTPRDSAIFVVKDPAGNDTPARYRWAGTAATSGDYLIWVSKPADYHASRFKVKVTTRDAKPRPMQYAKTDKTGIALYDAMRRFINAFRRTDEAAFIAAFSRTKPSYHLNPINIGSRQAYRTAVSYKQLDDDLKRKRGWYWSYLERGQDGDMDALIDHFPNGNAWIRVPGNRFVPPGEEVDSMVSVKWRMEVGRWVVDEISYPQA